MYQPCMQFLSRSVYNVAWATARYQRACMRLQGREVQGQANAAQKTIAKFAASYRVSQVTLDHADTNRRPASPDDVDDAETEANQTTVSLGNAVRAPVQTLRSAVAGAPL